MDYPWKWLRRRLGAFFLITSRPTVSAADSFLDDPMDFDLADGVWVLERTPGTLRALLGGLPSAWTDATEGPDTWSP
jgi:hypothetical protein